MNELSDLANELEYSEIIKLEFYVQEQLAKGKDICDLIIGDFDTNRFPMPDYLREKIQQAYDQRHNDYPPLEGVSSLREEVVKLSKKTFLVDYDPDGEILISGGARPLLYTALLTLVSAGESVIYPTPSWNNMFYAMMCGAKPVPIETSAKNNFLPTANDLKQHIKTARVIALCSPQNPIGAMFTKNMLEEICDLVLAENKRRLVVNQKPLYVIYDQVYWMLTLQNVEHYNPITLRPEIKEYLIVVDAGTKSFAATGIRVGWAMGPKHIIGKMQLMLEHIGAMAPKAEQLATAVLLQNTEYLENYLNTFKQKILSAMSVLHAGIQEMKAQGLPVDSFMPMAGIYMSLKLNVENMQMPSGKKIQNSNDVSVYLIDQAGFAIVPFASFGCTSIESEQWFRAAVCTIAPEEIEAALPRIKAALQALSTEQVLLEA